MKKRDYKTTENNTLQQGLHELYNVWFKKWKNEKMNNEKWDEAVKELVNITAAYEHCTVVRGLAEPLLTELEERQKLWKG